MRLALLALLCACAGAPPRPAPSDPLAELNLAARAAYAEARERAQADAGPVLIVGPARITLLHAGARGEFELRPARYDDLKAIDHFALGLHSLHFQASPDPARVAELRALAARALDALGSRGLTPAQLERQREIVRLSLAPDGAQGSAAWERAVAPLLLANALDAARAEIADIDAAVAAARRALGAAEFARLHVIVVGAHMARDGEIAMQYFEKLFGEREGLRLVFAEGLWDEPSELQLLATHVLDASVGEGFFGDARRMHRDLLADAAAQVLAERGR
jgi:hypothetical protein